ncbi:hypothetical protein FGLOB1_12545 [Fusarium globosum]|uniref:Uncharacterized protein n=1 Tax=Fusarium globosum TaxID=78864 RepID=A0A8H5XPL8_9HYPO|nr:hypothetical protein FGLOB1_12545 [Fusarium globosum]
MPRNNSKRYFSETANHQPSRGRGFGRDRTASRGQRNVSNNSSSSRRPSGQLQQQQQQQQQAAAPAAKEAEAKMAHWEEQATSHFNNMKKFEDLYKTAIDKLADWKEKRDERPETPVAKTAIEQSLQKALDERAAKRRKIQDKEEEEEEEKEEKKEKEE